MSYSQRLDVVANISLITAAVAIVAVTAFQTMRTPSFAGRQPQRAAVEDVRNLELPLGDKLASKEASAPLVLVEFSDFECPFCARFENDILTRLHEEFILPGRVAHVFVNYPNEVLHRFAFQAAEAAECARERGRYQEMSRRLFANGGRLGWADLINHADSVGVDRQFFESCLRAGKAEVVRRDIEIGKRAGIQATPTFLVGRVRTPGLAVIVKRINGVRDYETFRAVLKTLS